MRQMVRGNGSMPGETKQQYSRETKHKKVRKEEKRQGEWYDQDRATAGSMWPTLRLSVQERGVKEMQQGREDERVEEGVRENMKV